MSEATDTVRTHTLSFPQLDREIATSEEETIFHSARLHGVRIVGACGGRGTCGSCLVRIADGDYDYVGDAGEKEKRNDKSWVRSCLIRARADCTVDVAPRSVAPIAQAETDSGGLEHLSLDTDITAHVVTVAAATLEDSVSDADRICRDLGPGIDSVDLEAVRQLPGALRRSITDNTWSLKAWTRGPELIGFDSEERRTLGLAVDLGTTNAAGFLVDLESGERLASVGIENPQVAWGADVVSRINFAATDQESLSELKAAAVEAVNVLAHDLTMNIGHSARDIVDVVICGNTAMHHLFLGLPVRQLGRAPFVAVVCGGLDIKARDLSLTVAPGAWAHVAPNIGGYVGGDHVAALLATEDDWAVGGITVVMDIGTNTEISILHGGACISASAPSGPALEGGHISCGMRAADGAIERVVIKDGRLAVSTINDKEAVGLCGSGVLDALAVFLRAGLIGAQGRIANAHPDIVEIEGKRVVRFADGVYFTQDDVRSVQLAKSAIRTATELLLDEAGVGVGDIDRFIIAGSFGAYIDLASGVDIGLFPRLSPEKFLQVGNAAGVGVRRMLASKQARVRAAQLAKASRYMELSTRPDFQKTFLHNIGFNDLADTGNVP